MTAKSKSLKATVGATAAALLLSYVPQFEGVILRGYKDPIGIVTACSGHTLTAVLGRPYTEAECQVLLEQDLVEHAGPVLECVPDLAGHPYQLASSVSLAFNIGTPKFCRSTAAKRFNAGDWPGACDAMTWWRKAGGVVYPGLVKRRSIERDLCLTGLPDA
jgi:lysozyme